MRVHAEASQIACDLMNLFRGKRLPKRRHDLGEAAKASAVGNYGFPSLIVLRGGLVAECEIGECVGRLEAAKLLGRALPVFAVTGYAGGAVDLLASF